jgi:elongation factor G
MSNTNAKTKKNIALAGHAGSGKTTLCEALLYRSGTTERMGKIAEENTVSDYTAEEMKRKSSVYTAVATLHLDNLDVNILDTPGMLDFAGEMVSGIHASDCVMITVSGKSGVRVGTHKAYDQAVAMKKPRMFVVTKLDDENANFYNVLTELKSEFGSAVCPVIVPVIADRKVVSYVNLIEMKAYRFDDQGNPVETDMPTAEVSEKMSYRIDGLVEAFSEAVAETDEELFEKFFSGEPFTQKERVDGLHAGICSGVITPVVCASATTLGGISLLMKEMDLLIPEAENQVDAVDAAGDPIELSCTPEDPATVYVFKTAADPFVGKLTYMKVLSGTIRSGEDLVIARSGNVQRLGKLVTLCGKKQREVTSAGKGDIVAATKMDVSTGDTLCSAERVAAIEPPVYPVPSYRMAVAPATRGDEAKIATAMQRLLESDMTLRYEQDPNTKEQILSGLGEQHLLAVASQLKYDFGVEISLTLPKVAYRETIRKKVKVQGRYKKQSGGHGQFGDVWIEFEPCLSEDLIFEEKVFGGAVPKNFFPAVEKGLQDSVKKGILAGFPVVGVKAILVDGSYHPVDSSEMSFKTAASLAYKEGMRQADPTLLEPIGALEVAVPDENTGDMMGELNKRRGRVLGMNPSAQHKGMTDIIAEVPVREMGDFALLLRQMTQGRGEFTFHLVRYEPLPPNLMADVIASAGTYAE